MHLYSEELLAELRRLPGANHSFLKQLAAPEGQPLRAVLEQARAEVGESVAQRWSQVLTSLDNRRFFQGFGETAASRILTAAGWQLRSVQPEGGLLLATDPAGNEVDLLVLSFIHQVRPGPDRAVIERLARSLDRAGSRSRLVVLVRRWLPHDFDPEPVRRAVEMWLREVDRGGWDGRYAAYDDEHVSLEFALTGEQAQGDAGVVAFTLGPFAAHRTLQILESQLIFELDSWRMRGGGQRRPVWVACVADQPWRINRGYQRELFLGKPNWTRVDEAGVTFSFSDDYAPALFRDPQYRCVSGVLMIERPSDDPTGLRARGWMNPWATWPQAAGSLGALPCLVKDGTEDGAAVLRWQEGPQAQGPSVG